jgi:hypothetical protein
MTAPLLRRPRLGRAALAALLAAVALPALAYLLPVSSVLRHMGQKREALSLASLEVTATLQADGPTADRLHAALGQPAGGGASATARFLMKVPGRCKLEIPGATPAESPSLTLRDGRLAGAAGLDADPAAAALVQALCTLLATSTAGDASPAYGAALARRGVSLHEVSLGRFDGRVAYVVGGKPHEQKPLAFVDKDSFQPLRLVATEGGALADVRLLGWGSPTGGDWFPRAVEVVIGDQVRLRLTTEKTTANARIPEGVL